MKPDIFAADYATQAALADALDDNDEFNPDRVEFDTITGTDLAEVVRQAKSLNYTSQDECYRVRRLTWEEKMHQYAPSEYFDCFTLESVSQ